MGSRPGRAARWDTISMVTFDLLSHTVELLGDQLIVLSAEEDSSHTVDFSGWSGGKLPVRSGPQTSLHHAGIKNDCGGGSDFTLVVSVCSYPCGY